MTMELPKYSDLHGNYYTLGLQPPFYFQGMNTRVFPLRANLATLQSLIDNYANNIPPEQGRFRVWAPYVYLMLVDYGRLSLAQQNLGWLSQIEIMFAIPVEWYKVVQGRWEFHDWAWITPFIFENSEISLILGRTVYGWPKMICHLPPSASAWLHDVNAPIEAAKVATMILPSTYDNAREELRTFLELQHRPAVQYTVPPDFTSPYMPGVATQNYMQNIWNFGEDMVGFAAGMGLMPFHPGADPENYLRKTARAGAMFNPFFPDLTANTINLKQFRHANVPGNYCYQALTSGKMRVTSIRGGGLLAGPNLFFGDISGGYSIKLYRWPSLPIVDTLGLEVKRQWQGDGAEVVEVEPIMPFWYEVDMIYDRGIPIAWRTFDTLWRNDNGQVVPQSQDFVQNPAQFNATLPSSSSVAGPFSFHDATVCVMPLLAHRERLQAFLEDFLNVPLNATGSSPVGIKFEVWYSPNPRDLAYVYMASTNYGEVVSQTNSMGDWASRECMFYVPVRKLKWDGNVWKVIGVGFVPAFTYTNSSTTMISATEVLGIPATKGFFVDPPRTWPGTAPEQQLRESLLTIMLEVIPGLNTGQEAVQRPVIEIEEGEVALASEADAWADVAQQWGYAVREETKRKWTLKKNQPIELRNARTMGLDILARKVPVCTYTLKQFRDVSDPQKACYQSLVEVDNIIEHIERVMEIECPMHVRIHEYGSQPIVAPLGLVASIAKNQDGGVVYALRPVRPFQVCLRFRQNLGNETFYRSGSKEWQPLPQVPGGYFADGVSTHGAEPALDGVLADISPYKIEAAIQERPDNVGDGISVVDAIHTIEGFDLQTIIESILSSEWYRPDENSRWYEHRKKIYDDFLNEMQLVGVDAAWAAEQSFFAEIIAELDLAKYPHDMLDVHRKYDLLVTFGTAHSLLDPLLSADVPPVPPADFVAAITPIITLDPNNIVGLALTDRERINALKQAIDPAIVADPATEWADLQVSAIDRTELLAAIAKAHIAQRDALLDKIAKEYQKPDFVAPRTSVGSECDAVFPMADSLDDTWYVGDP